MTGALNPRLAGALRTITVRPDCRAATVGQRRIYATGPRAMRAELTAAIYDEFHAGRAQSPVSAHIDLRDRGAEQRFRELMPHDDTIRISPVLDIDTDQILVELDGVRVWVPRERVDTGDSALCRGATVQAHLPAERAALSPGFFFAESARRWIQHGTILRVYVHITDMRAAFGMWAGMLRMLEDRGISYRAKIASSSRMLPRRDALVLYVPGEDNQIARLVASVSEGIAGIGPATSVFARPVAPGVATAREPADHRPGMRGLSFGEHRSAVLARALIEHATGSASAGGQSPAPAASPAPPGTTWDPRTGNAALTAIRAALVDARIDPADPSVNLPCPDAPGST